MCLSDFFVGVTDEMAVRTGIFHSIPRNKAYKKTAFDLRPFEVRFYSTGQRSNKIFIFFGDFKACRGPGRPFSRGIQACKPSADKEAAAVALSLSVAKLFSSKGYCDLLQRVHVSSGADCKADLAFITIVFFFRQGFCRDKLRIRNHRRQYNC
jgi:hypothetical protein